MSTGQNSLSNRFLPFSNIEMDAVFTIDDDQKVSVGEIELAFRYININLRNVHKSFRKFVSHLNMTVHMSLEFGERIEIR